MAQESTAVEFETLKKNIETNSKTKIRLEERLNNATDNMKKVVADVRAAGYDPKTLETVRAEKSAELDSAMSKLRSDVQAQTKEISDIESSL